MIIFKHWTSRRPDLDSKGGTIAIAVNACPADNPDRNLYLRSDCDASMAIVPPLLSRSGLLEVQCLNMIILIFYDHIQILWSYIYFMIIFRLYDYIHILWSYSYFMIIFIFYDHIQILWSYSYFMIIFIFYDHIHILWSYSYFMIIFRLYDHIHILWSYSYFMIIFR